MLGNKRYSANSLGTKTYSSSNQGNKNYGGITKGFATGSHTADGIIHNYSNSAEQQREPIKGIQIQSSKKSHLIIEKPRKRSDSKEIYL